MRRRFAQGTFLIGITIILFSCKDQQNGHQKLILETFRDIPVFYEKLKEGFELQKCISNHIYPDLETTPVDGNNTADIADDPAIWYNNENPSKSLVFATNKEKGIHVFDINGKQIQFLNYAAFNNIDLRDGFLINSQPETIVAASNTKSNSISFFTIDKNLLRLSECILEVKSDLKGVYGLTMYKQQDEKLYTFVCDKTGSIEQWELVLENDTLAASKVRTFSLGSKAEGMVVDDDNEILYVAVEEKGIFSVIANPERNLKITKLMGSDDRNDYIGFEIEGISLFDYNNQKYLMASIQGNFSFALFSLGGLNNYLTSFIIGSNGIDAVENTDGIEICQRSLNTRFPEGLIVVQDGVNVDNDEVVSQNFKYIDIRKVFNLLSE